MVSDFRQPLNKVASQRKSSTGEKNFPWENLIFTLLFFKKSDGKKKKMNYWDDKTDNKRGRGCNLNPGSLGTFFRNLSYILY